MGKNKKQFKSYEDMLLSVELNGDIAEGYYICANDDMVMVTECDIEKIDLSVL